MNDRPPDAETQTQTFTLFDTIENIKGALAAGDHARAHALWLFLLNAAGERYFESLAQQPNPNHSEAAQSAMNALIAVFNLIPDEPTYRPARDLVNALVALLVEAPTGKREHPLFSGRGWEGTYDKGSLRQQHVIGLSLASVWLLEQHHHNRPVRFVADCLKGAGYEAKRGTVSSWKSRLSSGTIAQTVMENEKNWAIAEGLLDEPRDPARAERIVSERLKSAVATCL